MSVVNETDVMDSTQSFHCDLVVELGCFPMSTTYGESGDPSPVARLLTMKISLLKMKM
jgi:hypothetical protein